MDVEEAEDSLPKDDSGEPSPISDDEDKDDFIITNTRKSTKRIIDSDEESGDDSEIQSGKNNLSPHKGEENKNGFIEEKDVHNSGANEMVSQDDSSSNGFKDKQTLSNQDYEITKDNERNVTAMDVVKKSSLYDSESSCEEADLVENHDDNNDNHCEDSLQEKQPTPKVYRKSNPRKKGETEAEKPKKMTGGDAAKQRQEIKAESQRMLRESNISLPYHKPKSYSIKEFLQRRSQLPSASQLIAKASPAVSMKMSRTKMEEISKTLDERIKLVEEDFYKSDTDSDSNEPIEEEPNKEKEIKELIRDWLNFVVDSAVDQSESKKISPENAAASDDSFMDDIFAKFNKGPVDNHPITNEDPPKVSNKYNEDFLLMDDENPSHSDHKTDETIEKTPATGASKVHIISDILVCTRPKLSGGPNDMIDFGEDDRPPPPSGVRKLMEKFMQHSMIGNNRHTPSKHKVETSILEVSTQGDIEQKVVSMEIEDEEVLPETETPGAKLHKLREELQNQMAEKRSQMWKEKQESMLPFDENLDGECMGKDVAEEEFWDDEEEEDMTDSSSEDEEEDKDDLLQDDVVLKEKRQPKSAFLDDEADDVDEIEGDAEHESKKKCKGQDFDNDEEEEEEEEQEEEAEDANDADRAEHPENEDLQPKKRTLKRIIKAFTEDSDDEDNGDDSKNDRITTKDSTQIQENTQDLSEDDAITPNLPGANQVTPQRPNRTSIDYDFLSPLTCLQGSASKFTEPESPVFRLPQTSPLSINNRSSLTQPSLSHKKLFEDQPNDKTICEDKSENLVVANEMESQVTATQDLLDICSGTFFASAVPSSDRESINLKESLTTNETQSATSNESNENSNIDSDLFISQLLDESEMQKFKKKFDSPLVVANRDGLLNSKTFSDGELNEVQATGVINSDDEGDDVQLKSQRGVRRKKKLVFLEDDDDEETEESHEEEIVEDNEEYDQENVNYDSEENEIETGKASDFLDGEAELSESDWESADEDEAGLDQLDIELGDDENIDEKKMRSEIGRIHMRRLLDDDNREVKILQEMLLEDGELHGTGRQRQFRWKNSGNDDVEGTDPQKEEDGIFVEEEESEEQWRLMRCKREMFLKTKTVTEDIETILGDSQVLKSGQKVLKKSGTGLLSTTMEKTVVATSVTTTKTPFTLMGKRGSFLSRSDQVLQRLVEYNKVTGNNNAAGATVAKNSKGFIFQSVGNVDLVANKSKEGGVSSIYNKKRKATDSTPKAIKKLRLGDLSPVVGKKNEKSSKAKLFGNLGDW